MIRFLPLIILSIGAFFVSVAMSLAVVFIPVKLNEIFVGEHLVGALLSLEPLLIIIFCLFLPNMLRFQGVIYWIWLMLPIKGIAFNLMQYTNAWSWGIAIVLLGISGGGQITLYQYWCSLYCDRVFTRHRGMMLAVFATAVSLGLAAGPYFQQLEQPMFLLMPMALEFGLNSAPGLILIFGILGTLPAFFIHRCAPQKQNKQALSFKNCFQRSKGSMLAIVTAGCCFFSCTGFLVLYGLDNHLEQSPYLFSAFILGALVLELPLAAISDRYDRKYIIVISVVVSMSCVSFLPIAITHFYYAISLLFIWGGFMGGIYSVALALIAEQSEEDGLMVSTCTYTMMENIGGMAGLVLTGILTALIGGDALVYVLMTACLLYFAYSLTRYPMR